MTLYICGGIGVIGAVVLVLSLCKISARSDRFIDEMVRKGVNDAQSCED